METITQTLKNSSSVPELTKLYKFCKDEGLVHNFLDLAVIHRSFIALKVVISLEGVTILKSPYKSQDKVHPLGLSKLLERSSPEYKEVTQFILQQIEEQKIWNRHKGILWVKKSKKSSLLERLPRGVFRHMCEEFL